jgi:signal transduction histidine kinase
VSCNPGELNQVFLNLIVNAAHAVSDRPNSRALQKGKIKIQTRRVKDRVEVSVSDNASGIPQGLESKIFNPFFTTKGIGKGTGQGLAIARSIIVDRHKGEIDVDTTRDDGTRFLIKLPVTG